MKRLSLLALVFLAACTNKPMDPRAHDYRLRHAIQVERAEARLVIASVRGLTPLEQAELADFGREQARRGEGWVVVTVGAASEQDAVAIDAARQIAELLAAEGVRPMQLDLRLMIDGQIAVHQAEIIGDRYVAHLPDCSLSTDLKQNDENEQNENFGCATQRNIGAMVVNPRDLIKPRTMGHADAERGAVVMVNWRLGQATQGVFNNLPIATGAGRSNTLESTGSGK